MGKVGVRDLYFPRYQSKTIEPTAEAVGSHLYPLLVRKLLPPLAAAVREVGMFTSRLVRRIHNENEQVALTITSTVGRNTDFEGSSIPH